MGFVPGFSEELTRKFQSSNLHKKIQVQPFAILVPEMLVPVKTLLFFSVQKFYIYIYIYIGLPKLEQVRLGDFPDMLSAGHWNKTGKSSVST